ncbi:uncharacterized protein LOC113492987 [Trichoplusia ni]|uniref:Uncharacterized protein LOC113492987 n=1 Tax=Trichoplusia ni TaxID=7111 RepID=A0A7E5VE54_TRINI|nr:uncharacterized protein LOC113492987 [Trichoplusia ni]XP_026726546.1 uncharacterized protein LOC113492987 [Trichoplusia ni]
METEVEETRFQLTAPSKTAITEKIHYKDPRFHLHIVQKEETTSRRPAIHSLKKERLAYYRIFTSSTSKSSIIPEQNMNVNNLLWFYTLNTFFKTVPHSFVHFFISAYAPEEHMFITKMVPVSHGLKYLFIVAGVLDLLITTDTLVLLLQYSVAGLLLKNPWNRCPNPATYYDQFHNVTMHCLELNEFVKMFNNKSYRVSGFRFLLDEDNHFQVAQIDYYRMHVYHAEYIRDFSMFILIWGCLTVCQQFATEKYFWKVIYHTQWIVNAADVATFLFMALAAYGKESNKISPILVDEVHHSTAMWSTDLDLLSESITAPPIVHVLTSRSNQEIDPSMDSAIMVLSNAILFIFRGLHRLKLLAHVQARLHTEIPVDQFNQHPWFYLFPIMWSEFYLGDIFSNAYFIINLVLEYLVIAITYHCVIESIVYEWPRLTRWMCMITFGISGILMFIFTTVDDRVVLWTYAKGIATLMETVFLYMFYPVGRLADDYTFLYGRAPTKLRMLSMRIVPVYYIFKFYIMMDSLFQEMEESNIGTDVWHYYWSWCLFTLPIIGGTAYITYKYLMVYRMTWNYMLRPKPRWGPQDFSERQLRKQFDTRYHIGSEAPKLLTRYLNGKRESKVYKIDVRYDFYRRSTVSPMAVRFGMHKED